MTPEKKAKYSIVLVLFSSIRFSFSLINKVTLFDSSESSFKARSYSTLSSKSLYSVILPLSFSISIA